MYKNSLHFRAAGALLLGSVLVALCYFFVDEPVARFVHGYRLVPYAWLRWPPTISDHLKNAAALAIAVVIVWWLVKPGGRRQRAWLAISAGVIGATLLKQVLKWCFGRTWPEAWRPGDGPTLINQGVYGFHPFHHGSPYASFPSGHAAVICAVLAVLWFSYPRARWCYVLGGLGTCAAMVACNYHFVGDVVAGSILGAITGIYASKWVVGGR